VSNGIAFTPPRFFLALLIAPLLVMAGCGQPVSPSPLPHAAVVSQPDPSGMGRQRSDPVRQRVWILGSQGLFLQDRSAGTLVEVALPSWQWVDEPYGCPPDLALGPDGEAVVSSNIVPVLWRIDPKTLAVTEIARGPATPAFTGTATAIPVGNELWLGSFNADRVAYRSLK